MKHLLIPLALLAMAACKEEAVQDVTARPLTAETTGHFCQMNLLEHDGPKAQAHLAGLPGMPLFFSQVRDVVAYVRLPEQSHEILAIWVNDMGAPGATWAVPGAENWIDANEAHFVVGGQATGGMGAPEIVPFSDATLAARFAEAQGGQVMQLKDIPDGAALTPVVSGGDSDDINFEERLRALSRISGG